MFDWFNLENIKDRCKGDIAFVVVLILNVFCVFYGLYMGSVLFLLSIAAVVYLLWVGSKPRG